MQDLTIQQAIDPGEWFGRRAATKFSAADVESLRAIRSKKLYRASQLTWEDFCKQRVGVDRSNADAMIRKLDELGAAYFHLAGIIRISPQRFRQIAGVVTERGVKFDGELIPFEPSQAVRLAAAVKDLTLRAESGGSGSARRLQRAETALKTALAGLENVSTLQMDLLQRQSLHATFEHAMEKLGRLSCIVPH
jgi:hypothetical protein